MSKFVTKKINGYFVTFFKTENNMFIQKITLNDEVIYENCDNEEDLELQIEKHNKNVLNLLKHKEKLYGNINRDSSEKSTYIIFLSATLILTIASLFLNAPVFTLILSGFSVYNLSTLISKYIKLNADKIDLNLLEQTIDYELARTHQNESELRYGKDHVEEHQISPKTNTNEKRSIFSENRANPLNVFDADEPYIKIK